MFKKFIISCLVLNAIVFADVENSIIPTIDKLEKIENIPKNKVSDSHFNKISGVLSQIDQKVRLVTYNLLCDDREQKVEEMNKWHNRIPRVIELVNEMRPDIICVQEQYQHQLNAWVPQLGKHYSFYGSPRFDGEVNGVIYRNDRFNLIEASVLTIPTNRSKTNTVTITKLMDSKTGKSFAILNIHMTYSSNIERENEAEFITKQVREVVKDMPLILAGDLNMFPFLADQPFPYFDGDYVHLVLTQDVLKNSQERSLLGHVGPTGTFTNVSSDDPAPFKGLGVPGVMLDRIYISEGVDVIIHAVQSGTVNNYFPSDHMPLLIDFIISKI